MKAAKKIYSDNKQLLSLWQQVKDEDDKNAFSQLAKSQYRLLFNYATNNFTKDSEFVKDIIQDLFLHIWEQRHSISMQFVSIYLIKALRNKLINKLKKSEWLRDVTDLEHAENIQDDFIIESDIIEGEFFIENKERIKQAIASLPKRQQEVITLKFYQALDNEKIAIQMDMNRQSVANLLHRALTSLKESLYNKPQFLSIYLFFFFLSS